MLYELIDRLDWWVLLLITFGALLLASELGHRAGERSSRVASPHSTDDGDHPGDERKSSQAVVLLAALLGLLGLLLAFSFSIVESRFSARKALVLEEANAIGTAYLRAGALPPRERTELRALLGEYVGLRASDRHDRGRLPAAIARSEQLHRAMWRHAEEVARANPESEAAGLFLASLNEVIDLHQERVTTALYFRLPPPIFGTLHLVALLGAALMGYASGLARSRVTGAHAATVLVISLVLALVVELDRPLQSIVEVNQRSLHDVEQTIARAERQAELARRDAAR